MLYEAKPRSDIRNVRWCREQGDGVNVFVAWLDFIKSDLKSSKLHDVLSKNEFLWIQYDAIIAANMQPLTCLEEAIFNGVCPHARVVDALCLIWECRDDFVEPAGVPTSGCNISLRRGTVAITAPGGDEGREMSVTCPDGDRVVSIPCVEYRFFLATGDRSCLVEWGWGVVGFS